MELLLLLLGDVPAGERPVVEASSTE